MVRYRYDKKNYYSKLLVAEETLRVLKTSLSKINPSVNPDDLEAYMDSVIKRFTDFNEFVCDVCESFLLFNSLFIEDLNNKKIVSSCCPKLIDENMKKVLVSMVDLRNRETHDYYVTEYNSDVIEFCNQSYNILVEFYNLVRDSFLDEKASEEIKKQMSRSKSFKNL